MAEIVTISDLVIGDIVSFNTYGIGVVNNVLNATLIGFESGVALRNPTAAAATHANIYSSLPNLPTSPTPNNYTQYNYLLLKQSDSSVIEIGEPWINPVSLSRLVRGSVTVVISDFDSSQLSTLNDVLVSNGFINYTLTTASS